MGCLGPEYPKNSVVLGGEIEPFATERVGAIVAKEPRAGKGTGVSELGLDI